MEISVIVITYNQEETISRTLESILHQEIDVEYEILIGDDCSNDKTADICRAYSERYPEKIRLIAREKNVGVAKNYFDCIFQSRGKYLADCAGDDYWVDKDKLRKEYEIMRKDPEVSLVHTDWKYNEVGEGGNTRVYARPESVEMVSVEVFGKGESCSAILSREPKAMIHLCTAMYRRDMIIEAYNQSPELYVSEEYGCEDLQIMMAMAAKGKIVYLPEVTLHYSVGIDSVSHSKSFTRKFDQVYGNIILTRRLQNYYGVSDAIMRSYYSTSINYLVAQAFHSGDPIRRERLKELLRDIPIQLELKRRVYLALMSNRRVWAPARKILRRKESL